MSEFRVLIGTDNAAFEEGDRGMEVARILRAVADRVEEGATVGQTRDVNGNEVGAFKYYD